MAIVTGAGLRDKRITIEYPVETRGTDYSDPQQVWEPFGDVFAQIEPISGREYFLNREQQTEITVRIRMDYRPGITNKMRVNYRGKLYQIVTPVDPLEQHEELELVCSDFDQVAP
jgi:SPP1 family predicted phage head-tail adaptor